MRLIGKHPRQPTWRHFRCDVCGDEFWGPPPPKNSKSDTCDGCDKPLLPPNTGGLGGVSEAHDIRYHGGKFGAGEW